MKKKLFVFVVVLILSAFDIQPKAVSAQSSQMRIETRVMTHNNMTYRVFSSSAGLYVVNITKEQLEIEKLQLEIQLLKRR